MEQRLPIVTRWTLYALGAVEGQRVRRPRDPVAAWLLRRHPKLLPTFAAPSILAMIRARAAIVDQLIEGEVNRVRHAGGMLTYWSFGGGFDARWYRLRPALRDVIGTHFEVDDPEVLGFKDHALTDSSFAGAWGRIERVPIQEGGWTIRRHEGPDALVVLEGVATRIGLDGLRRVLSRIRRDDPRARIVVDLPGILQPPRMHRAIAVGSARSRWASPHGTGASAISTTDLKTLGYTPAIDVWLAARPELRAPSGMAICSGMEALRLMLLVPSLS